MKSIFRILLRIFILSLCLFNHNLVQAQTLKHQKPPSDSTWQYFFKMPKKDRIKLWIQKQKQGVKLGHWAWQWRLAWIKSCGHARATYCNEVLETALTDKALVVRAEATRVIGIIFENSKNTQVLRSLIKAYKNPRNSRNSKPLFIQYYILSSIRKVNGKNAMHYGLKLSKKDHRTHAFWKKLNRQRH